MLLAFDQQPVSAGSSFCLRHGHFAVGGGSGRYHQRRTAGVASRQLPTSALSTQSSLNYRDCDLPTWTRLMYICTTLFVCVCCCAASRRESFKHKLCRRREAWRVPNDPRIQSASLSNGAAVHRIPKTAQIFRTNMLRRCSRAKCYRSRYQHIWTECMCLFSKECYAAQGMVSK